MTIPERQVRGDKKRERTRWQQVADERWPDGMDMVAPAYGDGRWATLAWCGGLVVHLHPTRQAADGALGAIDHNGCGHACWRDHELVDLAAPVTATPLQDAARALRRASHLSACRVCLYVYNGQGAKAARQRHGAEQ